MPNSRRRRFSVQNEIRAETTKTQNSTQVSQISVGPGKSTPSITLSAKFLKQNNKTTPSTSKNSSSLEIINHVKDKSKSESITNGLTKSDKDITASSSNIDLFNILSMTESTMADRYKTNDKKYAADTKQKDTVGSRREKQWRQHRIKVRSPKRKPLTPTAEKHEINTRSVGTKTLDETEVEVYSIQLIETVESEVPIAEVEEEDDPSSHSIEDMCRICHGGESLSQELGQLISTCACRGTVGRVHVKCLERWLTESGKNRCELCGTKYATRRVHRYGVLRALVMWILSQNAKQLMVDTLGIMLMSPLADNI
ncbi:unnamed protein product, partial [Leptidea sinapis]